MKKSFLVVLMTVLIPQITMAQQTNSSVELSVAIKNLDKAISVKDYKRLEKKFINLAVSQKTNWLPYYYAAYCSVSIAFLYRDDGEAVEPFANDADELARTAKSLLDTAKQKRELAEVYTMLCMVNQYRGCSSIKCHMCKVWPNRSAIYR